MRTILVHMVSLDLVEFDLEKFDLGEDPFLSVCLTFDLPILSSQTKKLQTKKKGENFASLISYGRKYY